jgi:hypothetical protein
MRKVVKTSKLPAEFADLPLLITRTVLDKSLKWFQRREDSGELTPVRSNAGPVSYRREEVLRAVGILK